LGFYQRLGISKGGLHLQVGRPISDMNIEKEFSLEYNTIKPLESRVLKKEF